MPFRQKQTIGVLFSDPRGETRILRTLKELGFSADKDPLSSFERSKGASPGLLIVEASLAERFAEELLELKQRSDRAFLPVLVAVGARSPAEKWLHRGFDDVIRLPISAAELHARLQAFLRLREQSLRFAEQGETMFRALVEQSMIGVCLVLGNHLAYANDALCKMSGFSRRELYSRPAMEFIHEEDREQVKRMLEKPPSEQEKPAGYTLRGLRKDGSLIYLEVFGRQIRFQGKQAILAAAIDVTKQVETEQALRESERRYRLLVEMSPDAIFICQDDRVVFANQKAMELLGVQKAAELAGQPVRKIVHPEDWPAVKERIPGLMEGIRGAHPEEIRLVQKGGATIPVEVVGTALEWHGRPAVQIIARDLRERKQVEEAYRRLVIHSLQGLAILQEGRIVFANPALETLSGYSAQELYRMDPAAVSRLLHPEDRHWVWNRLRKCLSGEPIPVVSRFRFLRRDGEIRWVEALASRIEYRGKPAIQIAHLDITERIQAEEAFRRQISLNRQILRSVLDGYLLLTPEGRIVDVNPSYTRLVKYSRKELLRMNIRDLDTGLEDRELRRLLEKVLETGRVRFHTRHRRKDGGTVELDGSAVVVYEGEEPLIATFLRDVTKEKAAARSLKKITQRLRSLHRVDEQILHLSSPEDMARVALQHLKNFSDCSGGRIYHLNWESGTAHLLAYTGPKPAREERLCRIQGLPYVNRLEIQTFLTVHRYRDEWPAGFDSLPENVLEAAIYPLFSGMQLTGIIYLFFERIADPALLRTIVEEVGIPLGLGLHQLQLSEVVRRHTADLEAKVAERTRELKERIEEVELLNKSLVNILEDLHAAKQRLEQLTRELQQANADLESFAYSVSHDLRAPLRAIDGFSNILLEDYAEKLDDEGKEVIDVIRKNTRKMGQLIDDLLAFSRMGRKAMEQVPVDMNRIVAIVREELKHETENRNIHWLIHPLPPAMGDRTMLHQVWTNLLSNAIKFTRPKEEAIIEIGARELEKEIVYYVRDNGVGFPMKYAGRLFQVFQRLHGEEQFEGTGVGLAIVARIIQRHGGRVWAEGEINRGATFYFALPKNRHRIGQ